ncbi:hypothetical protein SELMODRAFT_404575 [Selaginella moellendorffii]|uniref:Uncharacterized protein n=1 Tax=Selaginella moellendorffii TaxID=88036 RepID=D8QVS2_SELML|nr:hypothetical protein SELMODRAFT_404575 [Selaginella moellendorffii]
MDRFVSAQEGLPLKWASSFRQTNCSEGGGKFLKLAGVTGSATALSKVLGLVRELVLAAVFGVGPVVDAFGYASIVPGFFLIILGARSQMKTGFFPLRLHHPLFYQVSLSLGILMYTLAAFLIDAIAPGVSGRYGIASLSPALSSILIILAEVFCSFWPRQWELWLNGFCSANTFGDSAAQAVSSLVKHCNGHFNGTAT